jgi:hypothetical protein
MFMSHDGTLAINGFLLKNPLILCIYLSSYCSCAAVLNYTCWYIYAHGWYMLIHK